MLCLLAGNLWWSAFATHAALATVRLPAFPGAVGQGAASVGGRGGDVYHVTNLDDYTPHREPKIPGSLRHAIRSAEGPRTIVFDVGGPIALHARLEILKSDLTVAGQTAPGAGITLWGYPLEVSRGTDVVVRFLRVRLGDFHARTANSSKTHPYQGNNDLDPRSANAVNISGDCQRVIFDHVSASWAMDETLSVTQCRDVTVQYCLIAASLNDSFHPKGPHGYGTLIRGELTAEDQAANRGGFTFFGNLWAHHRARNPSVGGQQRLDAGQSEADRRRTDLNLINNVIYDWHDQPTHRSENGEVRINMLGNYYVNGPERDVVRVFREDTADRTLVYQADNFIDPDQEPDHDGVEIQTDRQIATTFQDFDADDRLTSEDSGSPFDFVKCVAQQLKPAELAYNLVLDSVGCSLKRDAVDRQIVASVEERSGNIIDSQEELRSDNGILAGIDDLQVEHRPADFDSDGDGMSNEFEANHGLDPNNPADGNQTNLSDQGYTNLEVYLAELAAGK